MIPNLTLLIAVYCTLRALEIIVNEYRREGTAENPHSTASVFLFVAGVVAIITFGFLTYETIELASRSSLPLQ
jgi:hypothetical protein